MFFKHLETKISAYWWYWTSTWGLAVLKSTPAHGPSQDLNRQPSSYRSSSCPLSQRWEGVSASLRLHTAARWRPPTERSAGLREQAKVASSCTRSHAAAVWPCAPPEPPPTHPPPPVYLLTHLHPFLSVVNSFHWFLSFSFLFLFPEAHTHPPPLKKRIDISFFFCTVDFVFVKYY